MSPVELRLRVLELATRLPCATTTRDPEEAAKAILAVAERLETWACPPAETKAAEPLRMPGKRV